jgi:hypothetical protein
VLEDTLHAPEATTCEYRRRGGAGLLQINRGSGDFDRLFLRAARLIEHQQGGNKQQGAESKTAVVAADQGDSTGAGHGDLLGMTIHYMDMPYPQISLFTPK